MTFPVSFEKLKYYRSEFILITDPERESRELNWLKRAAIEIDANVEISGVSEYLASLAIVGPKSREVSFHFLIITSNKLRFVLLIVITVISM